LGINGGKVSVNLPYSLVDIGDNREERVYIFRECRILIIRKRS
jgi:hypothetical protein